MSNRYFVDEPLALGPVRLAGAEAHHLIHVMRAAPGAAVVLFDGSGAEFTAVVQCVRRGEVELLASSREAINRELHFDLTLGVALPKGDRQRWLIEKAVELGITRMAPLQTERSVAQPVEQALARLRRTVVEASKQCGRNRLMQIEEPQSWAEFARCRLDGRTGLLAHPQRLQAQASPNFGDPLADDVLLAVGPEGGFTEDEAALAVAAGWRAVDLGPRILRIETAALSLAAMVVAVKAGEWGRR